MAESRIVAVDDHAAIDRDDIAFAQHALRRGNAVHHLLVHRGAQHAGKTVIALEGRLLRPARRSSPSATFSRSIVVTPGFTMARTASKHLRARSRRRGASSPFPSAVLITIAMMPTCFPLARGAAPRHPGCSSVTAVDRSISIDFRKAALAPGSARPPVRSAPHMPASARQRPLRCRRRAARAPSDQSRRRCRPSAASE